MDCEKFERRQTEVAKLDNRNFEKIYESYQQKAEDDLLNREDDGMSTNPDKEQIVAVHKNEDGNLIAFKTNSGRELDYVSALSEAKAGELAHVDIFHKYGRDILRSEPDGIEGNNLDNLPQF
jgi:hypothetical protein